MNRFSVCAVSLLETAVIGCVAYLLISSWYPGDYFRIFEVGFQVSAFVIVLFILGPCLNVLVYKINKLDFLNDITIIYLIKVCVIFLGFHYAYVHRPVFTVFSVDRIVVVQAHQVPLEQLPPGIAALAKNGKEPVLIAARKLSDGNLGMMLEVMGGAPDIEYRPLQYEQFKYQVREFRDRMCRRSGRKQNERGIADQGDCGVVSVPLVFKADSYATAIFDVDETKMLEIIPSDPW